MMHMIFTVMFMAVLMAWLTYEFKRPVSIRNIGWIAGALAVQLLASIVSEIIGGIAGNFILHGVGGGVASALLFIYLIRTFRVMTSWRIELVLLFAFASSLGVLNELAEYLIETVFGIIMSVDSHDTWRDFVANTSGAFASWGIIKPLLKFIGTSKKQVNSPRKTADYKPKVS